MLSKFKERAKLCDEVTHRLRDFVAKGYVAPGEQLPTESALIKQLGVSRTVIREAISALRAEGLVVSIQGRGVFVNEKMTDRPFRIDAGAIEQKKHLTQIMELRLCLEVEASNLAAKRRDKDSMERIKAALASMVDVWRSGEAAFDEDFEFHLRICEAAGNSYMSSFLKFLGPFVIPRPAIRAQVGIDRKRYLKTLIAEHEAIQNAIEAGDAELAASAMRVHLTRGLRLNQSEQDKN